MYLTKGLYDISCWIFLNNAAYEGRISIYNTSGQRTWADGGGYLNATGYTSWRKAGGTIYLPTNDWHYISLGVSDSAFFSGFTMLPYVGADSASAAIADANKPNFQSDGDTNTNPFDNANDKVTLVDSSADGIHDAEMAALDGLDSANVIHQKLFFQGLSDSSSGGSSPWSEAEVDSMLNVMADANKPNFRSQGDTNKIQGATHTQVDSLKDTTEDMSTRLLATGFSTLTETELRDAIGDSLYNTRMDSLLTILVEVKGYSLDLAYYWGACDGCYYRLYPEGGLADKDSAIIIDPSQGADSLVGKVVYLHGTDVEIVDTVYFYRDEPW